MIRLARWEQPAPIGAVACRLAIVRPDNDDVGMREGLGPWLLGRTTAQRRRQEELLRRPAHTAIVLGVLFGVFMTLFFLIVRVGSPIAAVIGGLVACSLFGPLIVKVMSRAPRSNN
jgi:membrane associated rhomboid family serine protease